MSKNMLPMTLTVVSALGVYYLLATRTPLSEGLSMAGGVLAAAVCAAATRRLFKRG